MTIDEVLKAEGYTDEEAKALVENPKNSALLTKILKQSEEGQTALLKAREIEQNLKTWNETQVVPYVRGADEKVAKVTAELAATRAHMKALKDAGYDIPDSYFASEGTPLPVKTPDSPALDSKYVDDRAMDIARTNMALISMSNKYRSLTGGELDLDAEYEDFGKNRRPSENMREYVTRKYDIPGLEAKRSAAAEQKKLDDYAATKVQEEKSKWVQSNGVNPETRNPRSSRFDEIRKDEGRTKLWQTAAGREEATKRRLEKYTSLVQ